MFAYISKLDFDGVGADADDEDADADDDDDAGADEEERDEEEDGGDDAVEEAYDVNWSCLVFTAVSRFA